MTRRLLHNYTFADFNLKLEKEGYLLNDGAGKTPLPISFNDVLHFLLNFLRRRETTSAENPEESI
jgi:hypothetical protein